MHTCGPSGVLGTAVKFRNTGVPYSVDDSLRISVYVYTVCLLNIMWFSIRFSVNVGVTTFTTLTREAPVLRP